jgi:hypothetical protein
MIMGDFGEWWARTFEPEGTGGSDFYGGEKERREATKKAEEEAPKIAADKAQKEIDDAALKATEALQERKRRLVAGSRTVYGGALTSQAETTRKFLLGR